MLGAAPKRAGVKASMAG